MSDQYANTSPIISIFGTITLWVTNFITQADMVEVSDIAANVFMVLVSIITIINAWKLLVSNVKKFFSFITNLF